MICPACRHPMIVVEYKQTELDFCPNCRGTWFDKGELELMLESTGISGVNPFVKNILTTPAINTTERKRRCPLCGKKMKKTSIGDKNGVRLDVCEQGDGLWFDGGEVDQLVKVIEDQTHAQTGHYHIFNFMKEVFKAPAG